MSASEAELEPPPGYELSHTTTPDYPWLPFGMAGILFGGGYIVSTQTNIITPSAQMLALLFGAMIGVWLLHEGIHLVAYRVLGVTGQLVWHRFALVPAKETARRNTLLIVTAVPTIALGGICVVGLVLGSEFVTVFSSFALIITLMLAMPDLAGLLSLRPAGATDRIGYRVDGEFRILVYRKVQ